MEKVKAQETPAINTQSKLTPILAFLKLTKRGSFYVFTSCFCFSSFNAVPR